MFSIFFHFFGFPSMRSFSYRTAALAVRSRSAFPLSLCCVLAVSLLLLPWNAKSTDPTTFNTVTVTADYQPPSSPPIFQIRPSPMIENPDEDSDFDINRGATEQPTDDKRDKADACAGERSGNPVVLSTGNKVEQELDFTMPGEMGLFLERTFNAFWNAHGLFGHYWLRAPRTTGLYRWRKK